MNESTVTRTGRVTLKTNGAPPRYESSLVRQWSDGTTEYRLGDAARTSDGWVTLAADLVANVGWDAPECFGNGPNDVPA